MDLKSFKNSKVENQDDVRPKKLLLTRKQLDKIAQILRANNFTVIPFDLHFNKKGFLKVNIAISKGRKKEDLREYKKQQDWKREKQKKWKEKDDFNSNRIKSEVKFLRYAFG